MTPPSVRVYLGLGSNLGDRAAHLTCAAQMLAADPRLRITCASSVYETAPWGDEAQGPFLNAVVEAEAALEPRDLLALAQSIEERMGRERTRRWGPRVIDIDVLLYGDRTVEEANLRVPHPLLAERQFVLVPLVEVAPDLELPDGRRVAELADGDDPGVARHGAAPWPPCSGGEDT